MVCSVPVALLHKTKIIIHRFTFSRSILVFVGIAQIKMKIEECTKSSDNFFDSCCASHKYISDNVQRSTILYTKTKSSSYFLRSVVSFEFSFFAWFSSSKFLMRGFSSATFFDSFVIYFWLAQHSIPPFEFSENELFVHALIVHIQFEFQL